jgi:hypothetical protein
MDVQLISVIVMFAHGVHVFRLQAVDLSASSKEIRDLTRIERIGAHSHIRGNW